MFFLKRLLREFATSNQQPRHAGEGEMMASRQRRKDGLSNRDIKKTPKGGWFYCRCDRDAVSQSGDKCTTCKRKMSKKLRTCNAMRKSQ
jgi:hypothetical protein